MITGVQIRAAMGILGWSVRELAEKAGLGTTVISELKKIDGVKESAEYATLKNTHDVLNNALNCKGIELDPEGIVRYKNNKSSIANL